MTGRLGFSPAGPQAGMEMGGWGQRRLWGPHQEARPLTLDGRFTGLAHELVDGGQGRWLTLQEKGGPHGRPLGQRGGQCLPVLPQEGLGPQTPHAHLLSSLPFGPWQPLSGRKRNAWTPRPRASPPGSRPWAPPTGCRPHAGTNPRSPSGQRTGPAHCRGTSQAGSGFTAPPPIPRHGLQPHSAYRPRSAPRSWRPSPTSAPTCSVSGSLPELRGGHRRPLGGQRGPALAVRLSGCVGKGLTVGPTAPGSPRSPPLPLAPAVPGKPCKGETWLQPPWVWPPPSAPAPSVWIPLPRTSPCSVSPASRGLCVLTWAQGSTRPLALIRS